MTKETKAPAPVAPSILAGIRAASFNGAVADAMLARDIRAAGRAAPEVARAFKEGRIMRGLMKLADVDALADMGANARAAHDADLATQAAAILDKRGYLDPAKAGSDERAKDIRKQMRDNTRRNKTEQALEAAARKEWQRFQEAHGLKPKKPAPKPTKGADDKTAKGKADAAAKAEAEVIDNAAKAIRSGAIEPRKLVPNFANAGELGQWLNLQSEVFTEILQKKGPNGKQRAAMQAFVDAIADLAG